MMGAKSGREKGAQERPELKRGIESKGFRAYYYLKEELVAFCKEMGLQSTGGKQELTERIAHFLETGEKLRNRSSIKRSAVAGVMITLESIIEDNFVCSEVHRAFFKEVIGPSFSFKATFQRWLKVNSGKTYKEAVLAYKELQKKSKVQITKIDSQFEYNAYIRDFFKDNKGRTLQEGIKCWKYKKGQKGHNKYEAQDLAILGDVTNEI